MRVAVIGAGPGGLAALRHLSAKPEIFQPMAYEQTSQVGGTWVYTKNVGKDENRLPIHSSMYTNMYTNLPKEIMAYPDFPFSESLPSFIHHSEVLKYLQDYTAHFDLCRFIQFNTVVESVRPVLLNSGPTVSWEVQVRNLKQNNITTETQLFDAVIVCNGHYSVPLIPKLPGLDSFKGTVMHSHEYRDKFPFKDKTVVCLGAGLSGKDISLELEQTARKVYLCHRGERIGSKLPNKVAEKDGIREVTSTGIILDSGEALTADVLLFCTGYRYVFPFLKDGCKLDITSGRVYPLWKHLIHAVYPTLSVIGLPKGVNPFPLFDCQARFVAACLVGSVPLPSTGDMLADIKAEYKWRLSKGLPSKKAHDIRQLQWEYNDQLADMAGFPRLPKVIERVFNYLEGVKKVNIAGYKNDEYRVTGPETFEHVGPFKPEVWH